MLSIQSAASRKSKAKTMSTAGEKVSKDLMKRHVGKDRTKVSMDVKAPK